MFSGLMVIRFHTIPLQQRPIYCGTFGAILAVAFVVGLLIGGTFAEKVTWRWCFYINLPVGAISLIITFLILYLPNQKLNARASGGMAKLKQLDPICNLAFFSGIVCPVLALQ
jgi:MFS family permease